MELLVTVDKNYIPPLQVMLTSLHMNNPGEDVELYLLHSKLQEKELEPLEKQCGRLGYKFFPVKIEDSWFVQAPVTKQYPREMYYRLLAPCFLPQKLHRILYLDPDILVINSLRSLWETDMEGRLFAAAAHTGKTGNPSGRDFPVCRRTRQRASAAGSGYLKRSFWLQNPGAG